MTRHSFKIIFFLDSISVICTPESTPSVRTKSKKGSRAGPPRAGPRAGRRGGARGPARNGVYRSKKGSRTGPRVGPRVGRREGAREPTREPTRDGVNPTYRLASRSSCNSRRPDTAPQHLFRQLANPARSCRQPAPYQQRGPDTTNTLDTPLTCTPSPPTPLRHCPRCCRRSASDHQ